MAAPLPSGSLAHLVSVPSPCADWNELQNIFHFCDSEINRSLESTAAGILDANYYLTCLGEATDFRRLTCLGDTIPSAAGQELR